MNRSNSPAFSFPDGKHNDEPSRIRHVLLLGSGKPKGHHNSEGNNSQQSNSINLGSNQKRPAKKVESIGPSDVNTTKIGGSKTISFAPNNRAPPNFFAPSDGSCSYITGGGAFHKQPLRLGKQTAVGHGNGTMNIASENDDISTYNSILALGFNFQMQNQPATCQLPATNLLPSTPQMPMGAPRQHGIPSHSPASFIVPTPMAIPQQSTPNLSYGTKECCRNNLSPAHIPHNPLEDDENSSLLEKEIAWLSEECAVILPPSANDKAPQNKQQLLPLVLDFAWRHGSLPLREKLWLAFPSKISSMAPNWNSAEDNAVGYHNNDTRSTLVDGYDLLWPRHESPTNHDKEQFSRLQKEAKEARNALRGWGYSRSESIERELKTIHGFRFRDAVEEMGEPGTTKQPRHRRKRLRNADLLHAALGQDQSSGLQSATEDVETIASKIPSDLTPLEDEVAWLAEESLLLLPEDMLKKNGSSELGDGKAKVTESVTSAGLVTKSCEINWGYVASNASELLKEEFKRIGGLKRRPLQRIIRSHKQEVKCAFAKRRNDIASLLLLRGYRRSETKHSLPSHELLVQTGLDKVWAVKLMRRRQHEAAGDMASLKDLRSACNARLGDNEQSPKKRKKKSSCQTSAPKKKASPKKRPVRLAVTQKAQSSLLTPNEEEIAWLREEFECENGIKGYDWNYVEQNSSLPLLISLAERKCAPSGFPSVAGSSKLRTMVRLNIPSIEEAFERKRDDIRYAITQKGFRRDRSKHLPEILPAPATFNPPWVRKNGSAVLDLEYSDAVECGDNETTDICIDGGSKAALNEGPRDQMGLSQDRNDDCKDSGGDALVDMKEESRSSVDKGKDEVIEKDDTATALASKSFSSEISSSLSGEESKCENVDNDDEYVASSSDESEDDN